MKKRLTSLILALAMICGCLALRGSAKADNPIKISINSEGKLRFDDAIPDTVVIDPTTYYKLGNGNYVLADDVSLDHPLLVPENTTATLDLRGKQLIKKGSDASEVIYIKNNGTLTLNDSVGGGTIENGKIGGIIVDGKFIMNGGCITNNTSYSVGGGGVYNKSLAYFLMTGGSITGNKAFTGGSVSSEGKFQMTGGSITGNTAEYNTSKGNSGLGGGIYCSTNISNVTISDKAEISGNTAKNGGGVYSENGTITMNGGTIKNNQAENSGGGIFLGIYGGSLTMTGGSITGNRADHGGGIAQEHNGASEDNRITVSGEPTVSGNTATDQHNNVYLADNQRILVSGALTGGTIGVSISDANQIVAKPTDGYTITDSDAERFSCDDGVLGSVLNENREVILKKVITEDMVTAGSAVYNGKDQIGSIDVTVKSGNTVLTKDTDYTLSFEKDGKAVKTIRDAGEYTAIVTGKGDYCRSVKSLLTVEPKEAGLIWSGGPFTYNGKEQAPAAEATGLAEGDEVSVTVSGGQTNAGKKYTATAALTGAQKNNYKLPADNTFAFSIEPKSITGAAVTLNTTQLTYNGSEQSVNVTGVTIDGLTLTSDDYTVSGNTGRDKNTYTVTVTGKGNYKDTAAATWQIVEKAMTVTAESITVPYDGQPHGITVNVTDPAEGAVVKYGTAEGTYDLDASPTITDPGTQIVYFKVSAANYTDYTGSATVTVTAVDPPEPPTPDPVSISGAKISIDPQEYTGKAVNPKKITVTLNGTKLIKGTDYTVTFKNNKNIGKATATITGKGNYTGTKTATFSIVPKKISSASLKYRKKDNVLVVSWKKAAGIDGYEIEYGTDKHFKGAEKVKVSATKKTEYKIEKPTAKKTWYVRIRAWKKVKGKKYYSEWKVVSKKIK